MNKIQLNREIYRDKVKAAWIGKNIGGTIGGPFECKREFLDVKGFTTEKGTPLPNDDLDLQLLWLYVLEKEGPWNLRADVLGEYWLSCIIQHWAEYGICKANMRDGIPPLLSGEMHIGKWKDSNGAWIRSEIWACLAPGMPGIARKYAFEDATVDHGLGEGTYAELFTATLQSEAFFAKDIRTPIEKALAAIPADCRVAKAISLVIAEYDKGTPYREVREMLVELGKDQGWMLASTNLGFVVIGLLYGEGDFKNSMLYAVNCGDDTDCTAAAIGATLGILYGTAGIPEDWADYIGDTITTKCIVSTYRQFMAKTCTQLTDMVMRMLPTFLMANGIEVEFTDGEMNIPCRNAGISTNQLYDRAPWSFALPRCVYLTGIAEYNRLPIVKPGETITLRMRLKNLAYDAYNVRIKLILPEGWSASYGKSAALMEKGSAVWEAEVTVGELTDAQNHVLAVITPTTHMQPVIADFILEG